MNNNVTIEYDENIICKLKEMIELGLNKLKSFVKSDESKFEVFREMDERFNDIAKNLEKYEFLSNEFNYFLSISSKILYVIHRNCENHSFGHCEYAVELFDFFIEIWDVKIQFIHSKITFRGYDEIQKEFEKRYWEYEREFYLHVHESDEGYCEEEIYDIHKKLRG